MILSALVILMIISILIIVIVPHVIIFYLRRIFTTVQMKLFSPFSLRGILLNGSISSWGLSHLTIFISAIELKWSPKAFKFRLNFSNLQVYLSRRMSSLHSVNLINGNQEANILYNFVNFLFQDIDQKVQTSKLKKSRDSTASRILVKTTFSYFLEGMLHLFVIFLMKTFEIVLTDCKIFVVSGIPSNKIRFKTAEEKKQSLMLMQCLSEYNLKCDYIQVDELIEHHNKYKLLFSTERIIVDSYNHFQNHFISLQKIEMDLIVPFSMSMEESFEQIKTIFRIKSASVDMTVSDFQHFVQFIKEMIFNVNQKEVQSSSQSEKQVCLFVGKINLCLKEIFQEEFDNFQAKEYLSKLCSANVEITQFSLSQHNFSVKNSTLSITKFSKHSAEQKSIQILTLPNLQIIDRQAQQLIQISHDDVIVHCHSQEVAFFGKIFNLINQRIRFENYNQEIYRDLIQNFNPQGTLISEIERMITKNRQKHEEDFQRSVNSQKKLSYIPKKLVFLLKMKKLSHIITIDGFVYTRFHNLNEMSHQISVNKLTVQHKNFKQFSVSNFQLTFSETIVQKQLTMKITEIVMQQNVQTLIDYLDSFTLFKHLLQFESDQMSKPTKLLKKYIYIQSIAIHFENQLVNLKALKIDKASNINQLMNSLYFSIQRCQINLLKSAENKKQSIREGNFTFFWIDSFSLKTNYQERGDKIKPKTTIIIKNPSMNLPESNVSNIIMAYIKAYASLESHIEAFIINVTNEKLKSLKYHIKQFFIEPDHMIVIVTGLCLSICDTKFNRNLIAFNKTIRDYLLTDPKYNEAELISILRRNNKASFPLLILKIEKITLQRSPIRYLQPNEKSINQWIHEFQEMNSETIRTDTNERCRKVKGEKIHLKLKGISVNIRDYPAPILSMDEIKVEGQQLKTKRIFGRKMNFLKGQMVIGDIFVSIGLGQLSGWQEISKRLSQLNVINKTVQKQFRNNDKKYGLTIWHRFIEDWKWRLQLLKDNGTKIQILTGDTPYNGDKFELHIRKFFGLSTTKQTYFLVENFELNLKEFNILRMPRLEVIFQIKARMSMFDVFLQVKMTEDVCTFKISSYIIGYLQELVQLKKDWLLIYGIYEKQVQKDVLQLEDIQNMTYLEIVSLMAQKKFNQKNSNSILNYLNHFQLKFYAHEISVGIVDDDLELALKAKRLETFTLLQPDHDLFNEFKVRRSKINLEAVSLVFVKNSNPVVNIIRETRMNDQQKTTIGKFYQFAKCSNLTINFNWYFTQGNKMGLANQWICVENITAEVSKRMERYCLRMKKVLIFHKNSKREIEMQRQQKPINKLRKAVLQIIQINRRKKILRGHIKKYNTVVNLYNYDLLLKSQEKLLILQGKQKALFFQRIEYGEADKYHSLPCQILTLTFPSCKIMLSNGPYESDNFEIMNAGKLTLQIQMSDEKIDEGKCCFQDIQIEVTEEGKNILEEIIIFIVDLVNTNQIRLHKYGREVAKYEQLVNNGRQKLKEKIEWKQSDLKWKQKEVFWWNFVLKDLSILFSTADSKILSIRIDKTEMILHIFDNQKIQRKILFKNFLIVNELQPLDSEYRKILQLGKDNVGLAVIIDSYQVTAFSDVPWKYIKQLSFWMQPLKLRVTEQMLNLLIKYIGPTSRFKEDLAAYDDAREYKNKNPDYFKICCIQPLNLQLWFRSSNIFKRLQGIKLHLDKYEMKQVFYTENELARALGFWLLKQIGSQIFSLLGQKLFGDFQDSQSI